MSNFKLTAYRGDTIRLRVPVTRDDVAVNITGATFRFMARQWIGDSVPIINKANSSFVSSSPVTGVTILTILPVDTESLTDTTKLFCDVEMTETDGLVTTVAYGTLNVIADLTR